MDPESFTWCIRTPNSVAKLMNLEPVKANPPWMPIEPQLLSSLLAHGVRGSFLCVWFASPSQENFFHFLSIQLLPGKKKYLTQTESFLFEFLCNLLFYQFVILLISLSCTKAFIRIIIRELSDYFVVMTNWVVLCPAWWMGWIFLYSSGRQSLVFLTLMVLPWYVKQKASMSALQETVTSLASKKSSQNWCGNSWTQL